jgi:hypothetical protein
MADVQNDFKKLNDLETNLEELKDALLEITKKYGNQAFYKTAIDKETDLDRLISTKNMIVLDINKNRNSNNFFMGVSTKKEYGNNISEENNNNKNNNLKKLKSYNFSEGSNNYANKINSASSAEDAKKIVFRQNPHHGSI